MSLHDAAKANKAGDVKSLLAKGANPNEVDAKGATPLHAAASNGAVDAAKALLDGGANINAPDIDGNTPLHAACDAYRNDSTGDEKWSDMIEALVNSGAARLFNKAKKYPEPGEEADFTILKLMDVAEKQSKEARLAQKEQRMQATADAFNAKQSEYQASCSAAMVAVMDSGSHEGYKGAQHL